MSRDAAPIAADPLSSAQLPAPQLAAAQLSETQLPASQLPLTFMWLDNWSLCRISGADSAKYLQGQFTTDVLQMTKQQHLLAAHCDAKGKMWSALSLFPWGEDFYWIERRTVQQSQLEQLKKYAVFSKVTINADEQKRLLAVAGQGAGMALAHCLQQLQQSFPEQSSPQPSPLQPSPPQPSPPQQQPAQLPDEQKPLLISGQIAVLYFPLPQARYLLVCDPQQGQQISAALCQQQAQSATDQQWLTLDIEAGYPIIDADNSNQFLPQACNMQVFGGISFKKGCYSGQEMVARAKFRGANKRALCYLRGEASRLPAAGEDLEMRTGDNWRRTGRVLAAVAVQSRHGTNHEIMVQAVLNNDLPADSVFQVRNSQQGILRLMPLPYSLAENA